MSDINNFDQGKRNSIFTKIVNFLNLKFLKKEEQNSSLNSVLNYIILGLVFLLPIFFWPSWSVPSNLAKTLLVLIPTLTIFVLWIMSCLKSGRIEFLRNWIFVSAVGIILIYLLSSLFSFSIKASIIGQGYEIGTLAITTLLFVLFFLVSNVVNDRKKIFFIQIAVLSSAALLAIFYILRFVFGLKYLSLGILTNITSNTVGSWIDVGIFFGLVTLLSLVILENLNFTKKIYKYLAVFSLIIGIFFVSTANLLSIWYVLGAFAIISLVYSFSSGYVRSLPYTSLIVLSISLIFILSNGQLGNYISSKLGTNQDDVRLGWQSTYLISKETLKNKQILGVGPNQFNKEWLMYKPQAFNGSVYWNTNFNYGVGLIPTSFVTTGVVGFLGWLIFLSIFIYFGFRFILAKEINNIGRYLLLSSFFGSVYLWAMAFIYTPSFVNFALAFIFTGLTLAAGSVEGLISKSKIIFSDKPKKSFIFVLLLVVLILGSVSVCYVYVQKFLAARNFQQAILIQDSGDIDKISQYVYTAVTLDANPLYYRSLANIYISQLSSFANQLGQAKRKPTPDESQRIQNTMQAAFAAANEAIRIDNKSYENYLTLGQFYEFTLSAGIDGSYDGAINAYVKALELNPNSPLIYLMMARIELANKNPTKAKEDINKALELKSNYTDAFYLLSQIEISQGDIDKAISSLESATVFSPYEPDAFFQLGLLKYNQKDYSGAALAFERTVVLNNGYSNALYLLGLSYYKIGKLQEATSVFEYVKKLNPDNAEITSILNNLSRGLDPLNNPTSGTSTKTKATKGSKDR